MIEPYRLRVEARVTPREVEERFPTLSWALRGDRDGQRPVNATVVVRDSDDDVVWETGRLASDQQSVVYSGPPLARESRYRWTVEVSDDAGDVGGAGSWFETGAEGWSGAVWIGRDPEPFARVDATDRDAGSAYRPTARTMNLAPPLRLRRGFEVTADAVAARLHVSARGLVVAALNGERVGSDELVPGWTDYDRRIAYAAYDVTEALVRGENVLSAEVADGWWSGFVGFDSRHQAHHYGVAPQLIARLVIRFATGERMVVSTDERWRESPGELRWADLLMGEHRDDAFATEGWQHPGFDDSLWRPAVVLDADPGPLVGLRDEPVRAVDELAPVAVDERADRVVLDFGQNLVGRLRLPLAGGTVVVRHGEMLDDGELYTENLRSAEATDVFAGVRGVAEPRFTLHGFRYAELRGPVPDPWAVRAVVLSSDVEWTASATTSSDLVNRILSNVEWGQRGNVVSIPTDCPQRDERLGWTADAQVFAPTMTRNADLQALLGRWLDDLSGAQRASGSIPDVIPRSPATTLFDYGAPGWGDAVVHVPWALYRSYGDERVLRRHAGAMRRWLDYVARRNPEGLWIHGRGNDYGDWLSVDETTPHEVVATASHAHALAVAGRVAAVLGDDGWRQELQGRGDRVRAAFASAYLEGGRVRGDTQSGYAMTLAWDLAPEHERQALADRLAEKLEERGSRLTTGFLGVGLLCPVLTRFGRVDLAYDLLLQREYPSWGFSIDNGATTIWERWDGWTPERGFQTAEMNSFNHYSLGSVAEWIHTDVVGIAQSEASSGYRDVLVVPQVSDARLTSASGRLQTVRGLIETSWARSGDEVSLEVRLPPGTTGRARIGTLDLPLGSGRTAVTAHAPLAS